MAETGWQRLARAGVAALVAAVAGWALGGCAHLGYYSQSVGGHLRLMAAAQPVEQLLSDAQTPAPLRERLALSQRMRDFASAQLLLPDNASYRRYADLRRRAVVWNVVATAALSLKPVQSCVWVAGCVSCRGYFAEADAHAFAGELRAQGLDAQVFAVPAYSTLGWLNWMGGDPLLNPFVHYPEGELARLLFHELAHQVVYVSDDSAFNESFATFVEREGAARWLQQSTDRARADHDVFARRRAEFRGLLRETRRELLALYGETAHPLDDEAAPRAGMPAATVDPARLRAKQDILQRFRLRHAALRSAWGGYAGYDPWVEQAGNPLFVTDNLYESLVPGFAALFEREGRDWQRFYDAVRALATLPRAERRQRLQQLAPA